MLARRAAAWISKFSLMPIAHCRSTTQPFQIIRGLQSATQQREISPDNTVESRSEMQKPKDTKDDMLKNPDFFDVKKLFTVKDLFHAGVHLGHMSGTLDDRMRQFLFGKRFNQLIFDLDITAEYLRQALNVVSHVSYRGGIVLFVCRHRQNSHIVEQTAVDCGEYAHTRYWRGGVLTNSTVFFGSITRLPDILIFISTHNSVLESHIAIEQAAMMNIPSVGIVDTNCNPNLITYPVPGNDDSPSAVSFYCHVFKEAILNAKKKRIEDEKRLQKGDT